MVTAEKVIGDYQCGFWPGRSTVELIFTIRNILEKYYERNSNLHHLFMDYNQVYDELYEGRHSQSPRRIVQRFLYTKRSETGKYNTLSPVLFNMPLEIIIRGMQTRTGGCIYNRETQHLALPDNFIITGTVLY